MSERSVKRALAAGAAGVVLIAGGLFLGGTLASAADSTPQEDAAPEDGSDSSGNGEKNCDGDGDGQRDGAAPSGSGLRFGGGGAQRF
jgi:hypothetical protein